MYMYQHTCIVRLKKNTASESIEDLLYKKNKAITYGIKVHLLMKSTFLNLLELKSRTIHLHVMLVHVMQCILTKYIKMK